MGVTHCRRDLRKRQNCRMKSDSHFRFPRKYGIYTNFLKARLSDKTSRFWAFAALFSESTCPFDGPVESFASLTELPLSPPCGFPLRDWGYVGSFIRTSGKSPTRHFGEQRREGPRLLDPGPSRGRKLLLGTRGWVVRRNPVRMIITSRTCGKA
jgi:hypothetical protein